MNERADRWSNCKCGAWFKVLGVSVVGFCPYCGAALSAAPPNNGTYCIHGIKCALCADGISPAGTGQPINESAPSPEELAREFHETYERLAPQFGYETRKESAKPWAEVPEKNKRLMIAVCTALLRTHIGDEGRTGVSKEKLGTCNDSVWHNHDEPHTKSNLCVNWREQPAQPSAGEKPRYTPHTQTCSYWATNVCNCAEPSSPPATAGTVREFEEWYKQKYPDTPYADLEFDDFSKIAAEYAAERERPFKNAIKIIRRSLGLPEDHPTGEDLVAKLAEVMQFRQERDRLSQDVPAGTAREHDWWSGKANLSNNIETWVLKSDAEAYADEQVRQAEAFPHSGMRARELAIDICRELYDKFVMGGWQPVEAHDYVNDVIEGHTTSKLREAEAQYIKDKSKQATHLCNKIDDLRAEVAQLRQEAEAAKNDLMRISKALNQPGTQLVPIADRAIKAIEKLRQERDADEQMWRERCDAASKAGYEVAMEQEREARERAEKERDALKKDLEIADADAERYRTGGNKWSEMWQAEREARERAERALRERDERIAEHFESLRPAEGEISAPMWPSEIAAEIRALALVKSSERETK